MKPNEIDALFKLMDELMRTSFTGGYYPRNSNFIYNNRITDIRDDTEIDYEEDKDWIYLTIELRGVEKEDLNVELKEKAILIEAITEDKNIKKDYPLPCKINPKKSKICFNNYVLSLELKKVKERKKKCKSQH